MCFICEMRAAWSAADYLGGSWSSRQPSFWVTVIKQYLSWGCGGLFVNVALLASLWAKNKKTKKHIYISQHARQSGFNHLKLPPLKPPWPTLRNVTRVAWRTGSTTVFRDKEEVSVGEWSCGIWGQMRSETEVLLLLPLTEYLQVTAFLFLSTYHQSKLIHTFPYSNENSFYAFALFFL